MPSFAELTTLRLGGAIGQLLEPETTEDLVAVLRDVDAEAGRPLIVLGGGSNVVPPDDGAALVVRPRDDSVRVTPLEPDAAGTPRVYVTVGAGASWSGLVDRALDEGWCGFEALAGIPGSVGAAPVQNIGAYGHELGEILAGVRVWDRGRGSLRTVTPDALAPGYRTSSLKRAARARAAAEGEGRTVPRSGPGLVVVAVDFVAARSPLAAPVRYGELAEALGVAVGERPLARDVAAAVLGLRARKGMVVDPADRDTWSAGSFFTNPVLPAQAAARLPADAPRFEAGTDGAGQPLVKTSAAWLISHAGVPRGWGLNDRARTSSKHVLALTNQAGASAADILALAAYIAGRVKAEFGITLEQEPDIL
jgi:UDP-N-acetylmuramate dehydrogenase